MGSPVLVPRYGESRWCPPSRRIQSHSAPQFRLHFLGRDLLWVERSPVVQSWTPAALQPFRIEREQALGQVLAPYLHLVPPELRAEAEQIGVLRGELLLDDSAAQVRRLELDVGAVPVTHRLLECAPPRRDCLLDAEPLVVHLPDPVRVAFLQDVISATDPHE